VGKLFSKSIGKIGIYLTSDHVTVSEYSKNSRATSMFSDKRYELDGASHGLECLLNNKEIMRNVVADVKGQIGKRYMKVNVALADPYLMTKVIETKHEPKTTGDMSDYLRWRIKNDYFIENNNMALSYQVLGGINDKKTILVQLCDKNLLQFITELFESNLIPLHTIDSSYSYIHNYLYQIGDNCRPDLLFLHFGKSWSVISFDNDFMPQQIKSGWFDCDIKDSELVAKELKNVFRKVEREVYSDLLKMESGARSMPVIHIIGRGGLDYKELCKSSYSGECRILSDFLTRNSYIDYMNKAGEFCVARVAASCRR